MQQYPSKRLKSALASAGCVTLLVASLSVLSGCGSAINEGVGPETTVPSITGGGPNNTGTYPNLNIRPKAAAAQLTPAQRAATTSGLARSASAAQAGTATSDITPEEQAELLKEREKQEEILKQIEAGQ